MYKSLLTLHSNIYTAHTSLNLHEHSQILFDVPIFWVELLDRPPVWEFRDGMYGHYEL
jgi:hypothetical protein